MKDRLYRVSWISEELLLHGTSEKELIEVVAEYLKQPGKIKVELVVSIDPAPFTSKL